MLVYDLLEAQEKFEEICQKIVNKEVDGVVITIDGEPKIQIVPYEESAI